jgi:hypothetical protein
MPVLSPVAATDGHGAIVSRVRREGNQILWQLERVDGE